MPRILLGQPVYNRISASELGDRSRKSNQLFYNAITFEFNCRQKNIRTYHFHAMGGGSKNIDIKWNSHLKGRKEGEIKAVGPSAAADLRYTV